MKRLILGVLAAALPAALTASPVRADDVHLTNGGMISGIVRSESDWITIEVASGTVSIPSAQVVRVERTRHVLHDYYDRLAPIEKGKDPEALYKLAAWCREKGLSRSSIDLSKRVLALDPANEGAHALLGHQKRDGRWLSPDEARRADGQVEFRGRWVAAAERDRVLREEEEARQEALARYEERRRAAAAARTPERQETLVLGIGSVGEPYHRYYRPRSGRGRGGHIRGLRGVARPGSTIRR